MSSNLTCTRRLELDYAHRVLRHESKCASFHGHHGVVEISCSAASLDRAGRIIDFGEIKKIVGGWIDSNLDHTVILNQDDPLLTVLTSIYEGTIELLAKEGIQKSLSDYKRPYIVSFETTAENLARHIGDRAVDLLAPRSIKVERVRFWETPNGSAEWINDQ